MKQPSIPSSPSSPPPLTKYNKNLVLFDHMVDAAGGNPNPVHSAENVNPYAFNSNAEYQVHLKQQAYQKQLQQYYQLQQYIQQQQQQQQHVQQAYGHANQLYRQPSLPIMSSTALSPSRATNSTVNANVNATAMSMPMPMPLPLSSNKRTTTTSTSTATTPKHKLTHSKSVSSFTQSSSVHNTPTHPPNSNIYSTPLSAPPFMPSQHQYQFTASPSTPYRQKIRKAPSFNGYPNHNEISKVLDYNLIIEESNTKEPCNVVALELPSSNIQKVNADKFELFDKLNYLDLNNNIIQFNSLAILPNLNELYLSNNFIQNLDHNGYFNLTKLDLSHNLIDSNHVSSLMKIPKLVCLNLSFNNITKLPESMAEFASLETLYLEYNQLLQKNTMESLSTIPNLRLLNLSGNQWDRILPINGCFKSLVELSLCNNSITNLLNIGNIYHTAYPLLTRVQLWGNPLKSTSINFQVSKTIQLITDQPPVQPLSYPQQSPPPASMVLSNSQLLLLKQQQQQQQQQLQNMVIPTPFTYPPKEKKKQSTSASSTPVPSMTTHTSLSTGGKLSSSSHALLQQQSFGQQPVYTNSNSNSNSNNYYHHHSPKLNASEPIFYRHHNYHSDSEFGYEPFTPYKPPNPQQSAAQSNATNSSIEQPIFHINQQQQSHLHETLPSEDENDNEVNNILDSNNNNNNNINNTIVLTIDNDINNDNIDNIELNSNNIEEYVQSSLSQLQLNQQSQSPSHQLHQQQLQQQFQSEIMNNQIIEEEEDYVNEQEEMEFYNTAEPNYFNIHNNSNNEIILPINNN